MHLQTALVVTILAAAAGAAAGRATAPHAPAVVALSAPSSRSVAPGWSDTSAAGSAPREVSRATPSFAARERSARAPAAAVSGQQAAVVYVVGAVAKPGVYTMRTTARADEALRAAGGATAHADLVAINLAARVEDGEEIAVPIRGAAATVADAAGAQTRKHARRHDGKRAHRRKRHRQSEEVAGAADATDASSTADAPSEMVDVNAADEATLETLPGVGPSLAERIVAFRNLNGPFASTDELLDVGGMTAGKVDAISPYVTFRPAP